MPRRTADAIALIISIVISIVVILTSVALLYIQITHPEQDTTEAADAIGRIIGIMIGVLIAYMTLSHQMDDR